MRFAVTDCRIVELGRDARLPDHVRARVRVRLREALGVHEIELKLHVLVPPGEGAAAVQEAVLAKTAKVLSRTFAALETPPEVG